MAQAKSKTRRSQAAVDFMTTYGIALLIITIALYVVFSIGFGGASIAPETCTSSPDFGCTGMLLYANGIDIVTFSQATGSTLNITAAACASGVGSSGNGPAYGNAKVQGYAAAPQYYPDNSLQYGLSVYTGSSGSLKLYCYNSGGVAAQNLGTVYTGYIWLNYTYGGLPANVYTVQRTFQFTSQAS